MASYMQHQTNDGAIKHQGDDRTGDGDGDDEVIKIHLPQVSPQVNSIWPVITIYTKGKQFDDVSKAYVRILDPKSKQEFGRFNLSDNKDGVSTGCIVANIRRNGDSWTFKSLGYYVTNADTCDDVIPHIKEIMANNLKNIRILKGGKNIGKKNDNPQDDGCCCTIF